MKISVKPSPEVQKELNDLKEILEESGELKKESCDLSVSQREDIKWFNIAVLKNLFPQILSKSLKEEKTICYQELDSPKGLSVDQVLASKAFDYQIGADPEVEEVLKVASELAGKGDKRTEEENGRYQMIKNALKEILQPDGRTLIQRVTEEELFEEMKGKISVLEKKLIGENDDKN